MDNLSLSLNIILKTSSLSRRLNSNLSNNPIMPGHIKLVKGAVDPDPTEFLLPSMDMKKEDQNKP